MMTRVKRDLQERYFLNSLMSGDRVCTEQFSLIKVLSALNCRNVLRCPPLAAQELHGPPRKRHLILPSLMVVRIVGNMLSLALVVFCLDLLLDQCIHCRL
ncbi:hypothetical protein Y032_0455g1768 [Ancylostoma ceylanicum]|uniref:Uncharacterized protein n=1 Tax=Ancylostoma ceylanicum TaxID=53326 RepID=A0A016WZG6_9BILA|nr:hypothetical protein Y032_0455g1768 [Ancylostoma ceylanicum]